MTKVLNEIHAGRISVVPAIRCFGDIELVTWFRWPLYLIRLLVSLARKMNLLETYISINDAKHSKPVWIRRQTVFSSRSLPCQANQSTGKVTWVRIQRIYAQNVINARVHWWAHTMKRHFKWLYWSQEQSVECRRSHCVWSTANGW